MELSSFIQTCTLDGHLHRVTYTRYRINTIDSPDDEHRSALNMYRIGINIYKKLIVRQVFYLQEYVWSYVHCKLCALQVLKYSLC